MSNPDIASHLLVLSEKMDRYEKHRDELRKDIKTVSERQNEIVTLLAGCDLNNKKGVLHLIDEVDIRTRLLETENQLLKKDIDTSKFWGKTIAGLLVATIIVILNYIKDKT